MMPPTRTSDTARPVCRASTLSAAANRYCCTQAAAAPITKVAAQNPAKLPAVVARAATSAPAALTAAPITKPARRPTRRMSSATGTAAQARPTTSAVMGSVASNGDGASDCPMMPPASVTNGPAEAASACAALRMATVRHDSVRTAGCGTLEGYRAFAVIIRRS